MVLALNVKRIMYVIAAAWICAVQAQEPVLTDEAVVQGRSLKLLSHYSRCVVVESRFGIRLYTPLRAPCRFMRWGGQNPTAYPYPGIGMVIAMIGAPAPMEYFVLHGRGIPEASARCSDQYQGLVLAQSGAVRLSKLYGDGCPGGVDEKNYWMMAHDEFDDSIGSFLGFLNEYAKSMFEYQDGRLIVEEITVQGRSLQLVSNQRHCTVAEHALNISRRVPVEGPCVFVRRNDQPVTHSYPGIGTVVAIAGRAAPPKNLVEEKKSARALSERCTYQVAGVILGTGNVVLATDVMAGASALHISQQRLDQTRIVCPYAGLDEKTYAYFAKNPEENQLFDVLRREAPKENKPGERK